MLDYKLSLVESLSMLILTKFIYNLLINLFSPTIKNPLPNILQYLLTNLIQHGVTLEFPNSQSHWLHLCDFYPVYVFICFLKVLA